jgi:hypothetical protein
MRFSVSNLGTWTVTQDSDAPEGFGSSMKIDCTTADASPASTDTLFLYHALEGQNLQALAKGTADAKPVTLSFWVKSSKTGASQVNMRDADNTRVIGSSYSISSANTWEYKTVTFSGDTTGSLDNDNSKSLQLEWWLDAGTNYTSGSIPTSWQAVSNGDLCVDNLSLGDSTSNTWQITGVQLEVGDTATPFEHRSYGDELARCQRYYQVITNTSGEYAFVGAGLINSSAHLARCGVPLKQDMRAAPTASYSNLYAYDGSGVYAVTTFTAYSNKNNFAFDAVGTGLLANRGGSALIGTIAGSHFSLDAEL